MQLALAEQKATDIELLLAMKQTTNRLCNSAIQNNNLLEDASDKTSHDIINRLIQVFSKFDTSEKFRDSPESLSDLLQEKLSVAIKKSDLDLGLCHRYTFYALQRILLPSEALPEICDDAGVRIVSGPNGKTSVVGNTIVGSSGICASGMSNDIQSNEIEKEK